MMHIFQSVNPYFVCSNMSKIRKASMFIPSAETFVSSALGTVGLEDMTSGYLPHHLTVIEHFTVFFSSDYHDIDCFSVVRASYTLE